jgi:hypothetical protein
MTAVDIRWKRIVKDMRVRTRTHHVHGPRGIRLKDDECAVVSLVKDAGYFMDEFMKYHQGLGVAHFLIVDNGSTDDTIEIVTQYPNVTVVRNTLPPYGHETKLRCNIARRYIRGGWLLFLDSDEMFTPPLDQSKPLEAMAAYCNAHGYTAVVCQMLDMISNRSLSETAGWDYRSALSEFAFYSLDDIETLTYGEGQQHFYWQLLGNVCDTADIGVLFGGVRKTLFGERCCLTKHSFVRNAPEVKVLTHPHCAGDVVCADFTALIRHYKFCGDMLTRERAQVEANVWRHGQDRKRVETIDQAGLFRLTAPNARRYRDAGRLIDEGFLVRSDRLDAPASVSNRRARPEASGNSPRSTGPDGPGPERRATALP